MPTFAGRLQRAVVFVAAVFAVGTAAASAQVKASYLYTLSNFDGKLPYDWARLHADQARDETYVIYQNLVRVFNGSGMEVFSFGENLDLGQLVDLAVDESGDIILLSAKDSLPLVTRCDFRGVPVSRIEMRNFPASVEFGANRMVLRNGRLYFLVTSRGSVFVTDLSGEYREHIDLLGRLELEEKQRADTELTGFTVDGDGNIFFTVPVLFKVFKLTPDKVMNSFGRAGSAAGRFGVIAGVVTDGRGNIFVADKLRSVVMAFDKDFGFLVEFGYRGGRPQNLVVPDDLAIDGRGRLYVTQARRRGVSVFALTGE